MQKLLLFLLMLSPMLAIAQEKISVVTLKNGTELKGTIKAIDPTDALTMVIAGIETSIKMADVAKIEEVGMTPISGTNSAVSQLSNDEKLIVTDKADYPESFELKVGEETIKMILIRGGDLNMGFDGRNSRSMKSEPVHKVGVTSFYMSETFVNSSIVSEVTDKSRKKEYYKTSSWKKANEIVQKISDKTQLPLRLPTEAEWEYAACSPYQDSLFNPCSGNEYCLDWFGTFKDTESLLSTKNR